jgi:voltage-gated potassium channel
MKSGWGLLLFVVVFVASLLGFGTLGYRTIESGWSLGDAFYMTVITVSTVGFTELHPLSPQGRLFTMLLILLGLICISVIGACGARLLIDNEIKNVLGRKKVKKDITKLKDHHVVCGFGRIGSVICNELNRASLEFVIVEQDSVLVQQAEDFGYWVIKGDATSDLVLKEAGLERAHSVVAVLNSDAHNLFISLAAREINPEIKIIARGEESGIESRLLRAGANVVVSPLKLGGSQIAHMIRDERQSRKQEAAVAAENLTLLQIQNTETCQMTADQLMRQAKGLLAVAIQRTDGRTELMPSLDNTLEPQDTLLVCCSGQGGARA